jgi:hypothetical protein
MNENYITTINIEYSNGTWKEWITYEPIGGQNKADQ